ncbi:MAG: hypothetical protein PHD43_12940 [Methylococcales bacterium]|nr:hypothetical protein [Methylococcales bacterium]
MTPKALKKIKKDLLQMRKSPQGRKAEEFISLAQKLGRKKDNRGKEPTYVREREPALSPPLSIPAHGASDMKIGTARSIIDMLLDDVSDWELYFIEAEDDEED